MRRCGSHLSLITLAFLLLQGCGATGHHQTPPGVPLRAMTYNIDHGNGLDEKVNLARTAKVITDAKPDLAAIQEVDVKTRRTHGVDEAEQLGKLTGMHAVFGKAMDYSGGGYGIVILSRWPILKSETVNLPSVARGTEPRALLIVTTTAGENGPALQFACTHMEVDDQETRMKELEVLLAGLDRQPAVPLILAGDFNSQPGNPVIDRLKKQFASDTDETAMTYRSDKPTIKLDWIFHRPAGRFTLVATKVIEEPMASDHRPVIVDFVLHP